MAQPSKTGVIGKKCYYIETPISEKSVANMVVGNGK